MLRTRFLFTMLFSFFYFIPIFAAQNPSFVQNFQNALRKMEKHKSFQCDFHQELYSILRDKVSLSQGFVKIQSPQKFYFQIQQPQEEIYVSNGVDFWKYVPELKHAQHLQSNALQMSFLSLLTNPSSLTKLYKVSPWLNVTVTGQKINSTPVQSDAPPAENAESVGLMLQPKEDNSQKILYAIINVDKGFLEELRIVQKNGNRVRLLFSNQLDKKFGLRDFTFEPPQGIVVDKN